MFCGCGEYGYGWMVKDEVWEQISDVVDDCILCMSCAERRLGRDFTIDDFTEFPINNVIRFGYEIGRKES